MRDHFVYWMFDTEGACLYVGITRTPERRWAQHQMTKPEMTDQVGSRRLSGPYTAATAREIERREQDRLRPRYDARYSGNSYTLALRNDALAKLSEQHGIKTGSELAQVLKIHQSQLSRIQRGLAAPGERFLAGVLDAFGWDCLPDLFDIVPIGGEVPA